MGARKNNRLGDSGPILAVDLYTQAPQPRTRYSMTHAQTISPKADDSLKNFRSTKFFESLDGLRCISILMVLFEHCYSVFYPSIHTLWIGTAGVDIFFAISGFLIATLCLREQGKTGDIDLGGFYRRRILRIFPLYYLVFAIYLASALHARHGPLNVEFLHNAPWFALYLTNFMVHPRVDTLFFISWSLATEEQFYLVWPNLQKAAKTKKTAMIVGGVLLLALFGAVVTALPSGHSRVSDFLSHLSPSICLGVLLAYALNHEPTFALLRRFWTKWNIVVVMAVMVGLIAVGGPIRAFLFPFASAAIVWSAVQVPQHVLQKVLTLRLVSYIGKISYGMYLLHLLCHHFVKGFCDKYGVTDKVVQFGITVVVTVVVAGLSYRFFESWFLRLKRSPKQANYGGRPEPGEPVAGIEGPVAEVVGSTARN